MNPSRFSLFAAATLAFTVLIVIPWGVVVRATGSGAGCGSHWPTCNGEVIPTAPSTATLIEATHRATSGLAGLLVLVQLWLAIRSFPRGHLARRASAVSLFLMLTEGMIGAGLVLFEKVAHDRSIARGYWMSAHLINTFLLLAALGVVVWAAVHPTATLAAGRRRPSWLLAASLVAVLATGVSGAIAALGDTLFPAQSLASGLALDASPEAHLFVQLRALHPFLAAGTAVHLLIVASSLARSGDEKVRSVARLVGLTVLAQMAVGVINLLLLAPTAMQLLHLVVADVLWLALVWLTASVMSAPSGVALAASARRPATVAS